MPKLSTILILFTACTGPASAPDTPVETDTEEPIQDMADEFKSLRAIEGHFGGGTWNDDVDKWMGRKHRLMIELGARLGAGTYSKSQVIDMLVAPDLIAQRGDEFYELIDSLPEFERPAGSSYEFLVYDWRGEHDSDSGCAGVQRFGLSGHEYVPVKRGTTTSTGKAEFHCKQSPGRLTIGKTGQGASALPRSLSGRSRFVHYLRRSSRNTMPSDR